MMPSHPQGPLELSEADAEQLTARVMRRQLRLSLSVASLFFVLLFGLPLVNLFSPELANTSLFGFTLTWLVLGVLVYPVTVLLAFYFVRNSDRIEDECTRDLASNGTGNREVQP